MRALALEFSCRYIQPLLDIAAEHRIPLADLLTEWEVELPQLRDETNWVSLRFCEALSEHLTGWVDAETLAERVTRTVFSPRALGFVYPVLRTFGSPRRGYAGLPQLTRVLNKINGVEVLSLRRGEGVIEYRPLQPEFVERSPLICRLRRAQLAAGPTLWGLPPARVEELACQIRGDGRCVYRVQWAERAGVVGTVAGGGVGVLAGFALGGGPLVGLIALVGVLAGRLWDEHRQVAELRRFNREQTQALEAAATAAEQRFLELEKAKAEVDRQVEERTLALQRTTAQLQHSLAQLEELARVKDEFVANVSHELRTPLTLILGPLEDLLAGRPLADARDDLETMYRSAVRLSTMVTDLLDLARLQAGQLRLTLAPVDLAELIAGVVAQHRPLAQRRGLVLEHEPHDPVPLLGDTRRLEFAIGNLIGNAVKFTPAGGRVTVRLSATDDAAVVEVSDTGPGIPTSRQGQIFERFRRFDQPGAPGATGVGIGLALVRELVTLHRGSVALRSEEGHGATFVVTLPREWDVATAAAPTVADVPLPTGRVFVTALAGDGAAVETSAATSGDAAAELVHSADTPLILVVEDHDDMRTFLVRLLRRRYRVATAADGEQALAWLEHQRPDLVLSDVMMPGMNGYDLCRALKARPVTRALPVILITARQDVRWTLEGLDAGADDYVVKPFHADELEKRLEVHLRLRRLLDESVQQEKLAALGTIAAGLAHEVRNPAAALVAGLPKVHRELEQAGVLPRAREMLGVAIDCAERIRRLVDDVLVLGQPDRHGAAPVDVHEGLEVALRLLAHRVPTGVELRRRFAATRQVAGHAAALTQVFVNLLDNALHAVGTNGTIETATMDVDGGVAVAVHDSGPGVPPAVAGRIFDPFFTTKPAGQGTGLGLHLSRRIVTEHGGRLELDAATGAGARFRVWLPAASEGKRDP